MLALAAGMFAAGCDGGGGFSLGALELATDLVVTDLDGDGRLDVLVTTRHYGEQPAQGRLTVRRQNAAGHFDEPETVTLGCYPWRVTPADIDGDGRMDLVVADPGSGGPGGECGDASAGDSVLLVRQDPAAPGRFLAAERIATGPDIYQAAVADVDGDGAPDVVHGSLRRGSTHLVLLRQDPARRGRFLAPQTWPLPDGAGAAGAIVAGDLDGDVRDDLFVNLYGPSSDGVSISWLAVAQPGAGGVPVEAALVAGQTRLNAQRLAIGDVDGDGRPDLLAHFTPASAEAGPWLRVLRQTGTGAGGGAGSLAWSAPVDTSLAGLPGMSGTAFGDLDGDGRPDLVFAGSYPVNDTPFSASRIEGRVNVVFARGAEGRFGDALSTIVAPLPDAVAVGDLDGDGRRDIVLHDGTTFWWMRQAAGAPPGRFEAPRALP